MVTVTYQLMQTAHAATMSSAWVFEWFHHFKELQVSWTLFNQQKWWTSSL